MYLLNNKLSMIVLPFKKYIQNKMLSLKNKRVITGKNLEIS